MYCKLTRLMLLTCLVLAATFSCPDRARAGRLDDFEAEIDKPSREHHHAEEDDDDHDHDEVVGSCLSEFFGDLVEALAVSITETIRSPSRHLQDRPGDAILPTVRLDYAYQDVETDIGAHDLRLELGLRQIGVEVRTTHYREASPRDHLDLTSAHLLYRIAGDLVALDLGIGGLALEGNESHSGSSLTLPLTLSLHETLNLEFRPAWGYFETSHLSDYDLGLSFGRAYLALRCGYRWMRAGGQSLDGPYLGLSLRY